MDKIDKIIQESVNSFVVCETYKMQDIDELFGYMWLRPQKTNLNVDIFVDDGGAYIRDEHVPLVFARNGYNRTDNTFIPISIDECPIVLDEDIDIYINQEDLYNIFEFIKMNKDVLLAFANKEISLEEFKVKKLEHVMVENAIITEMATLTRQQSNLPMDVWLDEGVPSQHGPRLKFRANREQRNTRDFSSMSLTNPPHIFNLPQQIDVRTRDIEKLKQFVIVNIELLLQLANGEIDYETQFLPNMIKV